MSDYPITINEEECTDLQLPSYHKVGDWLEDSFNSRHERGSFEGPVDGLEICVKQRQTVESLNAAAKKTLTGFVDRGKTDRKLTLFNFCKCLEVCGLRKFVGPTKSSVWAAHQDFNRKISVGYILHTLIDRIASDFVWWQNGAPMDGPDQSDPRVQQLGYFIRKKIAFKAGVQIHEQIFDPIGDRLSMEGHMFEYRRQLMSSPRRGSPERR